MLVMLRHDGHFAFAVVLDSSLGCGGSVDGVTYVC